MMDEVRSVEELEKDLATYREQLQQVQELLQSEPENEEYREMAEQLPEVISLTEDLLRDAIDARAAAPAPVLPVGAAPGYLLPFAGLPGAPSSVPYGLPALALQGQQAGLDVGAGGKARRVLQKVIPGRLPLGAKVQALYSNDGNWYNATVQGHTESGYTVIYDDFGNEGELDASSVRPLEEEVEDPLKEAERNAEEARLALKRKLAEAAETEEVSREVPKSLRIDPDDSEDVKAQKRKKAHAWKSKQRLAEKELHQNKRQNAWQQFQTGKGKQKKAGFFTGRKKDSIFKSPEDVKGKVGVTGSGRDMTDFGKREKHLHMRTSVDDP